MMVVYDYGDAIQIDMYIHVTMDVWTICHIILGCFGVIEIWWNVGLLIGKD